jgi:hypothetical protein
MTAKVLCQPWIESEPGWTPRPNGYSLHLTETDLMTFVRAYWASIPDHPAPESYSGPSGMPYLIEADEGTMATLHLSTKPPGLRHYSTVPARPQDPSDIWRRTPAPVS